MFVTSRLPFITKKCTIDLKNRLKHHYLNPSTGEKSLFEEAIIFTIFPQFVATIIGYVYKFVFNRANSESGETGSV